LCAACFQVVFWRFFEGRTAPDDLFMVPRKVEIMSNRAENRVANRVVVGAQWGDEGKAKVVDYLTEEADYVIRFQGGANAGHTVEVGDQKFVFHLLPSGLMHEGKTCVIGNGVVLDPAQLLIEIEDVLTKGIDATGRLWVSEAA